MGRLSRQMMRQAAVVALLAVVAVGSIWLWGRHDPLTVRGDPPIGEAARKPADALVIADFAGLRQSIAPAQDFHGLVAAGMLTRAEIAAYAAGDPGRVRMAVGDLGDSTAAVVVVRMANAALARQAEATLTKLQIGFGFTSIPSERPLIGATVLGAIPGKPLILPGGRAHYVHGDLLIRVEFRGPGVASAQQRFARLLAEQLKALPADD